MYRFYYLVLLLVLFSCSSKKEEKIVQLDAIHRYYTDLAKSIPEDLINTCAEENSLHSLLDESYMTPKMHSSIMGVWGPYQNTCRIIEDELGTILSYKLDKIVDERIVYHFYYSLETTNNQIATLRLVLNKEYGMSEFHIYLSEEKGYRNILFPKK